MRTSEDQLDAASRYEAGAQSETSMKFYLFTIDGNTMYTQARILPLSASWHRGVMRGIREAPLRPYLIREVKPLPSWMTLCVPFSICLSTHVSLYPDCLSLYHNSSDSFPGPRSHLKGQLLPLPLLLILQQPNPRPL